MIDMQKWIDSGKKFLTKSLMRNLGYECRYMEQCLTKELIEMGVEEVLQKKMIQHIIEKATTPIFLIGYAGISLVNLIQSLGRENFPDADKMLVKQFMNELDDSFSTYIRIAI